MPYKKGETPDQLKDKGIPRDLIDQWIEVFNSVYHKTGSEKEAFIQANGVLHKEMEKRGYKKREDGRWVKESAHGRPVKLETPNEITILEEAVEGMPEGTLWFTGVALRDNIVSQRGMGRYYSKEFNDRCMENTLQRLREGKTPVTIYTRHGKAIPPPGAMTRDLPVGKVTDLWREGDNIMYKGCIVPTAEGKDAALLIRTGVQKPTSVRIGQFKSVKRKINGHVVEEAIDGVLYGVDLADEAGIEGAGIVHFESAPEWDEEESTEMEFEKLTLDDLKQHCLPLLEEYASEYIGKIEALQNQINELQSKVKDQPGTEVEELKTRVAELTFNLAIAKKSLTGVSQKVYEALLAKVKDVKDLDAAFAAVLPEALNSYLSAPAKDEGEPTGKAYPDKGEDEGEEEEEQDEEQIPEEWQHGLSLLSTKLNRRR